MHVDFVRLQVLDRHFPSLADKELLFTGDGHPGLFTRKKEKSSSGQTPAISTKFVLMTIFVADGRKMTKECPQKV